VGGGVKRKKPSDLYVPGVPNTIAKGGFPGTSGASSRYLPSRKLRAIELVAAFSQRLPEFPIQVLHDTLSKAESDRTDCRDNKDIEVLDQLIRVIKGELERRDSLQPVESRPVPTQIPQETSGGATRCDPTVRATSVPRTATTLSDERRHNEKARQQGSLKYRSVLKRSILVALTRDPHASDLEICGWLDEEGAGELPANWASASNDRSFETAYKDPRQRPKIHVTISKIRGDMRKNGLLD
jgi:hypothetical protein